ncbi:polysaccharide deacetylase family protein [Micromonospora sp. NBC_01796]|uniref:polysaccharide deacetylase family protein n=1 Tax=Micromonospora sp. NBC_01796 TaxID=2975987 RepID=UPI002DD7BC2F|nr:polysaccharide deacetylase family protein [Micromonospora sp. NBC_01796]WSA82818.1 polysaccharide deacetylase family protein [Micromonospora sp. NBC_01796]
MNGGQRRSGRRAALMATLGAVANAVPAVTVLPSLRLRLFPRLSGFGTTDHVALTFDDGPDPASTPRFAEALAAHRVRATFFLLGSTLADAPSVGRDLAAAGHEVAVHGWAHRNLLLRGPYSTHHDLLRARDLVQETTGQTPRFYRPPYGVLSAAALLAAHRLALSPVLWTCWGRDWTRTATPASVLATLRTGLNGGGTILLHDSDCASAPGAWRSSLAALPYLLDECARRGWRVGPLGEHGLPPRRPGRGRTGRTAGSDGRRGGRFSAPGPAAPRD